MNASRPVLAAAELASLIDELTPYFAACPHEPHPSQDHLDFRGSTFNGTVAAVQHNHYGTGTLHDPSGWTTVEAADPIGLGVRRTRRLDRDPELPPYVRRDIDEQLGALVSTGGLVVVTGEPLAGKSRTAWAAVRDALSPKTRVYGPSPGVDLHALPGVLRDRNGSYVLWLDELEGHLGERGLDSALLAQLSELHVPVVATMSDEAYDARRFGGGPAARVLARAETLELTCRWSEAELTRLGKKDDPRLADARRWHRERGVTEYLAVGPELWDEWWRARRVTAHPRGHGVVRVAVDLARLGVDKGVTPDVLEELSDYYEPLDGFDPGRESWADALAWATEVRHGVTGMLVGDGDDPRGGLRAFGSLAADAGRSSQTRTIPHEVLEAVRTLALDEGEGSAFHLRFAKAAVAHFMPQAAAGSAEALFRLGRYDHGLGLVRREHCLSEAAKQGHDRAAAALAELLMSRGDLTEAQPYLEQAAKAGDSEAAATLGTLLRDQAETWLRQAADAGNAAAAHQLGDMLVGTGREGEALRWYRKAAAAGRREVAASRGAPRTVPARSRVPQPRPTDVFADRLLAVLSGQRPVHWMLRHTAGRAYDELARLAENGPLRVTGGTRPVVRGIGYYVAREGAVEAFARIGAGDQVRAMAFRLERGADLRWCCTAVELGAPTPTPDTVKE
ncbi:Rv3235 family protein [Streptomyces sp. N50]|uniref:Rv3235 family protein n=1 Tax=Streptomyces sp. N50 TaxID=3081765 RepID=UPI00398D034D